MAKLNVIVEYLPVEIDPSISQSQKENLLEGNLLDIALISSQKFKEHATLLTDPAQAALLTTQATSAFVNLKKGRQSGFQETPDISILLRLEKALE